MSCVTCGSQFDTSFDAIVKRKKLEYEKNGTEYYIYKIGKIWSICKKEYFNVVYKEFKPTEYFHISEFKPN